MSSIKQTKEYLRLQEQGDGQIKPWEKWGPFLSERAWGTVREDYSPDGDAWNYFPFDHSHKRTYRWNEDGIGGICDRYQKLSLSFSFWNEKDSIIKERLFGLQPNEGNHGEDVKEYYYYLDATPTHSYLKFLYKYPQSSFPYEELITTNKNRTIEEEEYELLDTGIFKEDRYFDIFITYAKKEEDEIAIELTACNRGPESAPLHIIPQYWYRNTWSWNVTHDPKPTIYTDSNNNESLCIVADDLNLSLPGLPFKYSLGKRYLYATPGATPLFTNNETNTQDLWNTPSHTPYVKDGFHHHIINNAPTVNPKEEGTKAALHYYFPEVKSNKKVSIQLLLTNKKQKSPLTHISKTLLVRKKEADEFYEEVHPKKATEEEKEIQRQSLASLIWSKQFYHFRVNQWMKGDPAFPPPDPNREKIRNKNWRHINTMRILSMPDKWEYPWFAAWDLAFHTLPLALVDISFAKEQLWFLLFEQFFHPNGQIPAYEWEFSDLNPPVHAWAVWEIYQMEKKIYGKSDRNFIEKCFHKLLLNFSWWVNRVDPNGNNVFEGGFLGLDNITIFDRSDPLPEGVSLQQSDGTGWMGLFSLSLMRIALELSEENTVYESLAIKFFQHYVYIGAAIKRSNNKTYELWSEKDGFYYDVICYPDGSYHKFRVRSMVGIIPLFAVEILETSYINKFPEFKESFHWFIENRKNIVNECVYQRNNEEKSYYVMALMSPDQLKKVLNHLWNPAEFRSPYGLRSLSKYHENHPFKYGDSKVGYEPGESTCWIKGGNSNWRGPIWFPTTFLAIRSLLKLHQAYGNETLVEVDGQCVNIHLIAQYYAQGLLNLFLLDKTGKRPCFGEHPKFQEKHWKEYLLFYEHFHGCTGRGLGASHQTGWTGLIANIIDEWK